MTTTINWSAMTEHQRDTLIAEKVFAWQWISAECYGPHVKKGTAWLLPEQGLSAITYDFEAGWIDIGEKRFIPRNWIPHYTTSIDAAWQIILHLRSIGRASLLSDFADALAYSLLDFLQRGDAEDICVAALKSIGCEVQL